MGNSTKGDLYTYIHTYNISCTMFASKVYKSFVPGWTLGQVRLKNNQFGGSKGCGAAHLLIS